MQQQNAVLVYHNGDHWIAEYDGVYGHFEDERDATRAGRGMARSQLADLIVRNAFGQITLHEPYTPKKSK